MAFFGLALHGVSLVVRDERYVDFISCPIGGERSAARIDVFDVSDVTVSYDLALVTISLNLRISINSRIIIS